MGRIIITGGMGLIGTALTADLTTDGHEVVILSRNPARAKNLPSNTRAVAWDGRTAHGWGHLVDGARAIVNLAGATIGRPPWTASYKQRIRDSRLNAGRAVVEAVRAAQQKPAVVVQPSGVGYYGLHDDEWLTEDAPAGDDFLARVCVDWEASTAEVEALGVRRCVTRTGLVLSATGGVLPLMALPFRLFIGGPIGSGKQYVPWIHMADQIGAMRLLIENDAARGAFNLSTPNPVTNREFSQTLGRVLHRPSFMPAPAFAMKLALGEMADLLLLGGQRTLPQRLTELGYTFQFTDAERALRDLYQ